MSELIGYTPGCSTLEKDPVLQTSGSHIGIRRRTLHRHLDMPVAGGAGLMSIRRVGCPAALYSAYAEYKVIATMPDAVNQLERHQWCELEPGQAGLHYTAAQTSLDDLFWWLRWDDTGKRRELVNLSPCAAEEVPGDEDFDVCALPAQHTGAHSFTYDN